MASTSASSGSTTLLSLDAIVEAILSAKDDVQLNHFLKNYATKDSREVIFAGLLTAGQDPLLIIDAKTNTIGCLYLLSARLTVPGQSLPPLQVVQNFCRDFDPEKAQLAPERVTLLARGIKTAYTSTATLDQALPALLDLLTRYVPDLSYLSPLHSTFLRACVTTKRFSYALPVLEVPITEIDPAIFPDLHYNDHLIYHYVGGMALAALGRWADAEDFFEIVVSAPAQIPAAIQFEALKKLALVQLILYGKLRGMPRYINTALISTFKKSRYMPFVSAYPLQTTQLETLVTEDGPVFDFDRNLGLVKCALDRARRWSIKNLTETYITLSLSEIADAIKVNDQEVVRSIVLSMIQDGEIYGKIDANGIVTFEDADMVASRCISREQVDVLLAVAQRQNEILTLLDNKLECDRDFLNKIVKSREHWMPGSEEDIFGKSQSEPWIDDTIL